MSGAEAVLILGDPLDGIREHVVHSVRDWQRRGFVRSERVAHKETRHPCRRNTLIEEGVDEILHEVEIDSASGGENVHAMTHDHELLLWRELGAVILVHERMAISAWVNLATDPVGDRGLGRSKRNSGEGTDAHRRIAITSAARRDERNAELSHLNRPVALAALHLGSTCDLGLVALGHQ